MWIIMFRFVRTCTVAISLQSSSTIVFSFSFSSFWFLFLGSQFRVVCFVSALCHFGVTHLIQTAHVLIWCVFEKDGISFISFNENENGCSFSRWEFDASSCVKTHWFYTHRLFLKSKRRSSAPKQNRSICNLKLTPTPLPTLNPPMLKKRTSFGRRAIYVQGSHLSNSRNHVEQNWIWNQWWRWADDCEPLDPDPRVRVGD